MSVAKVLDKKSSEKEIRRKLKVSEYVFEIDGKDIYDTDIIYRLDNYESSTFKDGKKVEITMEKIINIELTGKDRDGKEAWISFYMKYNIDYLNSLSKIPIDISNLLMRSESFIKKPNEEESDILYFELPKNNEDDIYKCFTSLWISKLKKNEFIIKLIVPNELFTYFKLIIK